MQAQYTTQDIQRLRSKIDTNPSSWTGCHFWTASKNRNGYGQIWIQGKVRRAHRVVWEIANGNIPEGMCVLHKCDNRSCCNPEHLFVGTNEDNIADKVAKNRSQRMRGSSNGYAVLTEENVKEIISLHREGAKQSVLAKRFHVSKHAINKIVKGKNWSWLTNSA